jgi:hypothetical protein
LLKSEPFSREKNSVVPWCTNWVPGENISARLTVFVLADADNPVSFNEAPDALVAPHAFVCVRRANICSITPLSPFWNGPKRCPLSVAQALNRTEI